MIGRFDRLFSDDDKPKTKNRIPRPLSKGEEALAIQLRSYGIGFHREFKFCLTRRWRADFALDASYPPILIECEGGTFGKSRHTSGKGYAADCDKYNHAALMGWRVFRFTTQQVLDGTAIDLIRKAIA